MKKSELRQIIREELSNISESNESMFDRMEGLAPMRELKLLKDYLRIVATEWNSEGFEDEDVIEYLTNFVNQI